MARVRSSAAHARGAGPVGGRVASLRVELDDARARTDELFACLDPALLRERPVAERHRPIFYLGHLEAFDWNLLGRDVLGLGAHDAPLDELFAFGIDPTSDDGLPSDRASDWPALDRVRAYASSVRERVDAALERARDVRELAWTLAAAIEHRLMHAETLAYLLGALPIESKHRPRADEPVHRRRAALPPATIAIPAGRATLGARSDDDPSDPRGPFTWDVEHERTEVEVPAFAIDALPATNGDYLRFVDDGGYARRELWDDDAWTWVRERSIERPATWELDGDAHFLRGMFERRPLPLDVAVHASHAEASAFARWRGARLPTEAEWQRSAYATHDDVERAQPWGDAPPSSARGNFGFARFDPSPVATHPAGASAFGVEDLVGDGWEWTSTPLAPLPGYAPQAFYPGYSEPFFDGGHFVMKGAGPRTAHRLIRASFRNWFQPRFRAVAAKLRCVTSGT